MNAIDRLGRSARRGAVEFLYGLGFFVDVVKESALLSSRSSARAGSCTAC